MPLHQNQDGTWQWGKSGKKYKKKEDAIKQMKAIFANGYVQKHASYTDTLSMIKIARGTNWSALQARRAAGTQALKDIQKYVLNPVAPIQSYIGSNPYIQVKNKLGLPYTFKDIASSREAYDTSPTGYLKNPRIALRNALKMKQSSGNRYATNGKAIGAYQIRPIALQEGKDKGFADQSADVSTPLEPQSRFGWDYYQNINRDHNDPLIGYSRYFKGPYSYRKKAKNPAFKKSYPSQDLYAASIPQVRKFMQLLNRQNRLAAQASPVPVAK